MGFGWCFELGWQTIFGMNVWIVLYLLHARFFFVISHLFTSPVQTVRGFPSADKHEVITQLCRFHAQVI